MGRGETIKAQVATARRKRNWAVMGVASTAVLGCMSLLWLFSIDYTTVWFKIAAIIVAALAVTFFAAVWIYGGAQLALEEDQAKLAGRRK